MDYQDTDGSGAKMWWIIGIIVVLALIGWYLYGNGPSTVPSGNTTAEITTELTQIPDGSAELDAAAAASAQSVAGF